MLAGGTLTAIKVSAAEFPRGKLQNNTQIQAGGSGNHRTFFIYNSWNVFFFSYSAVKFPCGGYQQTGKTPALHPNSSWWLR